MRKISFILILLSLAVYGRAENNIQLELYGDTQENGGVRLKTPLMEVRTANHPDKYNTGILLSSKSFARSFPLELKYGNLSVSGSLSRLNSPELSSGTSPFSDGCLSVSGLTASLPGYTSFSKPESTFLQLSMNQPAKSPLSLSLSLWTSPENDSPVFSTLISDRFFSKRLTLSAACTAGKFYYEEKTSSSWFLDSPYYSAGSHFCSLFQLTADYKSKTNREKVSSSFMAVLYENPFGPYTAAYRSDLKITIKQAEFYSSAFLNAYEDIITSSGKELDPSCQFKCGMLFKKPLLTKNTGLVFLKFGINAYSRINLLQIEAPLRLNTGIQLSTDLTSLSFSISANAIAKADSPESPPKELKKDSLSFQIKNSWYIKSFTPAITLAVEKKENMKYKIQLNMTKSSKHKISGNCSFSFSEIDGNIRDKKLSASMTCRFNQKWLTIIGKAAASFSL